MSDAALDTVKRVCPYRPTGPSSSSGTERNRDIYCWGYWVWRNDSWRFESDGEPLANAHLAVCREEAHN